METKRKDRKKEKECCLKVVDKVSTAKECVRILNERIGKLPN